MDIDESQLAQVKKENDAIPEEIIDYDIKPDIVKEEPREADFVKCEICNEIPDDGTACVHIKNDGISEHKPDFKLQAPVLHSVDDLHLKSSIEDVKPKVEKTECSLDQKPDDSIVKLIDSEVTVDEEEYLDSPEYLSTNIDFVECATGEIKTEDVDIFCEDIKTESVKEEPSDNEASMSSDMLGQDEDSSEDVKPGTSRESPEAATMGQKRPITYDDLVETVDNLSEIEYLSDEDEFTEEKAFERESDELDIDVEFEVGADTEAGECLEKSKQEKMNEFMMENDLTYEKDTKWKSNVTFLTPNYRWMKKTRNPNWESGATKLESPLYFFRLYFVDELFLTMVQYTNLHATQQKSRFASTSVEELHTFVGIHIMMGNLHYPRIKFYWNTTHGLRVPLVADNMAVNRFYAIRNHLHFVDTQARDPSSSDRLWKVRPLYNTIRARCLVLPLESELAVRKQIVPFKGHLGVRTYMRNKPNPWGLKIYALYGSSGLLYDFIIYQGGTTELDAVEKDVFGLGGAVVSKLCTRVDQVPVKIFFDVFFSNYSVLQFLQNKQIYSTCTARPDQVRNPPLELDLDMRKRGRGATNEVISEDGQVIVTKWLANKPLYMASSFMGVGQVDLCKLWDKRKNRHVFIQRPQVVREYNKCMTGIDRLDVMVAAHTTFIRSKKWTLRMFTHAVDLACTNAWLEYRQKAADLHVPQKNLLDLLHFRAHVAEALILSNKVPNKNRTRSSAEAEGHPSSAKRSQVVRPVQEVRYDARNHWPIPEDKRFSSRCKMEGCKGTSRVKCEKCEVHLCLNKYKNCFFNFHTR